MSHLSTYAYVPTDVRMLRAGQTGGMPAIPHQEHDYSTTTTMPADTSIYLTRLTSQRSLAWRVGTDWPLISKRETKLRLLQEFCTLVDAEDVYRFLRLYPDAVDVLIEARPYIERIFGANTHVALEVTFDPDSAMPQESEELFANIQTSLPVDDALARLHKLDQDWFLGQLGRANGRLTISLEFV